MDYIYSLRSELQKGLNIVKDNLTGTDLQRKLKEATSDDHCHANISLLNELSSRTENYEDFGQIVTHCRRELSNPPIYWRKVLKDLFLIEHILRTGNMRFVDAMRDEEHRLKNLFNFKYIEENGADKGETSKYHIFLYKLFIKCFFNCSKGEIKVYC